MKIQNDLALRRTTLRARALHSKATLGFVVRLTSMLTVCFAGMFASSCAQLHHVQVAEMDLTQGPGVPFDIKTSSLGLNVSEAAGIVKGVAGHKSAVGKGAQTVDDVWKAITYGPRTGEVTFDASYADGIAQTLAAQCPYSRLTGLSVIRETAKYPVISGEIVRVSGYCRR